VGSAAVLKGEAASVVRDGSGVLRGAAPAACGAASPATCGLLWSPPRGRSGGGMGEADDLGGVWRGRKQDEGKAESGEQPLSWRTRLTAGLGTPQFAVLPPRRHVACYGRHLVVAPAAAWVRQTILEVFGEGESRMKAERKAVNNLWVGEQDSRRGSNSASEDVIFQGIRGLKDGMIGLASFSFGRLYVWPCCSLGYLIASYRIENNYAYSWT
jgi:hypothetical protein